MALLSAPALAAPTHIYTGTAFGPDGTASTSFERPATVAVDQGTHNVYVGDARVNVLYKFDENGQPVNFSGSAPYIEANKISGLSFPSAGGENQVAVDPNSGTIYVNSRPALRAFLPSGEPAEFTAGPGAGSSEIPGFKELLGVAVDQNGAIYAADYGGGPTPAAVSVFNPAGAPLASFGTFEPGNLAVDSQGDVYVGHYGGAVEEFVPSSFPVTATTTYSSGGVLDPNTTRSVAVDPGSDDIYATEAARVGQYDEAGTRISAFAGTGEPGALLSPEGVAVDGGSGEVFVSDSAGERRVEIFGPTVLVPTPVTGDASAIGKTSATVHGSVNPEGIELQSCAFEYGESTAYGQSAPCAETPTEIGAGTEPVAVHADLTGLVVGTDYHVRLVATNVNGESQAGDEAFRTLSPPVVTNEQVAGAGSSEAVVQAEVNPEGFASTYHVEYGLSSSYGKSTSERGVGSDSSPHLINVALAGLAPGSTYHWRVVATNSIGTSEGPDQLFNTSGATGPAQSCPNQAFRTGAAARLPDCRAYEMVSPVDKNNTDIRSLINIASTVVQLNQSSLSGDKLTYTTSQGFGDAQGTPYVSQYIASRGASGWENRNITPPQGITQLPIDKRIELEYSLFSPDLCQGWLMNSNMPTLTPDAGQGSFNVYQRDLCGSGGYKTLTTVAEPAVVEPNVQGTSADGRCTVFQRKVSGYPGQLYEVCDGQLRLVSVLPDGEPAPPGASAGTGGGVGRIRLGNVTGAVSSDGSRVYWTAGEERGSLYIRLNSDQAQSAVDGAGECTEPDKACTVLIANGEARFARATPDGSKAVYTLGNSLYQFDLATRTSLFIAASVPASTVGGLVGVSVDTARVYFASSDVLAGANSHGDLPVAGKANLYLHEGTEFSFIGTLDDLEADPPLRHLSPIAHFPYIRSSRVSSDGRFMAFMSTARLTGYDSTDSVTGEADAEIYRYDAISDKLTCVSCNPSGQRPVGRLISVDGGGLLDIGTRGAALLHPYQTELYGSRVLLDDGSRVFFDSYDALVPADTNGKADVYQWEAPGSGGCTPDAAAYSPLNEGCVSLISSGESPADSEFIDASPNGRDVFFATASSLVAQDPGLIDIYDAREGGGYSPLPGQPAACEGEACQSPPAPPNDPTPSSAAFNGAGNVGKEPQARCRKGKARRQGRCVAKKHQKHAKRAHGKANSDRRNGR
jgi:hypothetical protein